jgi:hypothetical protein
MQADTERMAKAAELALRIAKCVDWLPESEERDELWSLVDELARVLNRPHLRALVSASAEA